MAKSNTKFTKIYRLSQKKSGIFFKDRKRYDLGAAILVCQYWNEGHVSTPVYLKENLFVTNQGSWILYGEGGAETKYGKKLPNGNYVDSSKFIILSRIEAYEYLESISSLDDTLVEKYFFDIVEEG